VKTVLLRFADRLYDDGAAKHGTLPGLLVLATIATGAVDGVSYLGLHHIFVANMTGNVVFFGFALAGAQGLTVWAPALAIGAFIVGARLETLFAKRIEGVPAKRLFRAVGMHALFLAAALVVSIVGDPAKTPIQATLILLLGCGMGFQNGVVRKLALPDLTTTVLTMTVAGLAADRDGKATLRRLLSIGCILLGALCGAWLFLHHGVSAALTSSFVLLVVITGLARL
jgi:uncharacterized membrane protein YoaK (UPF0700 family)